VPPPASVLCPRPPGLLVPKREIVPDGSAVYVVVGKPRKMVASATVMQRDGESAFTYSRSNCR
jgi:hypothetical protein